MIREYIEALELAVTSGFITVKFAKEKAKKAFHSMEPKSVGFGMAGGSGHPMPLDRGYYSD